MVEQQIGHMKFLLDIALQPVDSWEYFYKPTSEQFSDESTKFQVAFSTYALYHLALQYPDYKEKCVIAMDRLIQKMLDKRCWSYWRKVSKNPDPIAEGNAMYSGHLLLMVGLYKKLSNDDKYDSNFILRLNQNTQFVYNYLTLTESIHNQMNRNHHHGITCQFGSVFVFCTNVGAIGLKEYDDIHKTSFSKVNDQWIHWMKENFIMKNPQKGVFHELYSSKLKVMDPFSFNGLDAPGLMTLAALQPELAEMLFKRFEKNAISQDTNEAYIQYETLAKVFNKLLVGILSKDATIGYSFIVFNQFSNDNQIVLNKLKSHIDQEYQIYWSDSWCLYQKPKAPILFTSYMVLTNYAKNSNLFS